MTYLIFLIEGAFRSLDLSWTLCQSRASCSLDNQTTYTAAWLRRASRAVQTCQQISTAISLVEISYLYRCTISFPCQCVSAHPESPSRVETRRATLWPYLDHIQINARVRDHDPRAGRPRREPRWCHTPYGFHVWVYLAASSQGIG